MSDDEHEECLQRFFERAPLPEDDATAWAYQLTMLAMLRVHHGVGTLDATDV